VEKEDRIRRENWLLNEEVQYDINVELRTVNIHCCALPTASVPI